MAEHDSHSSHDGRFLRIQRMIGSERLQRLQRSFVMVIGLGAVGSYATEALARAGVGRLRLVDFDVVQLTNINRQLYAMGSTLGQPKVDVARQRVLDINPACRVETMREFVHRETLDAVLADPPDLVIDAIDSLTPKVELIAEVTRRRIPLISCMGAAMRTDPTAIRVGPMSDSVCCPLAFKIRKRLRRRGTPLDFLCIYSTEPVPDLHDSSDPAPADYPVQRGRVRSVLGSLPTLTGIFGLTAANTAIKTLLDEPRISSSPILS